MKMNYCLFRFNKNKNIEIFVSIYMLEKYFAYLDSFCKSNFLLIK